MTIHQVCDQLDEAGVMHYIDLGGGWDEDRLQKHLENLKKTGRKNVMRLFRFTS